MQHSLLLIWFSATFRHSESDAMKSPITRVILSAAFVWCAALLLPPVLLSLGPPWAAAAHRLYEFFSPICHQLDDHSLHLFGYKLAVCARCFAIYAAFAAGGLVISFVPLPRPSNARLVWLAGSLPMLLDVALDSAGLHSSTIATRVITGGFFGVTAAFIILPLAVEAAAGIFHHLTTSRGTKHELQAR